MDERGRFDQVVTVQGVVLIRYLQYNLLLAEKHTEKKTEITVYAPFMDLQQVYDRVDRKTLPYRNFKKDSNGIGGKFLGALKAFYESVWEGKCFKNQYV